MRFEPHVSKAVCRVCGEVRALDSEGPEATADLAAFTSQHSIHDRFRIDVVTGPVVDSSVWRLPQQTTSCPADEDVRTA